MSEFLSRAAHASDRAASRDFAVTACFCGSGYQGLSLQALAAGDVLATGGLVDAIPFGPL